MFNIHSVKAIKRREKKMACPTFNMPISVGMAKGLVCAFIQTLSAFGNPGNSAT